MPPELAPYFAQAQTSKDAVTAAKAAYDAAVAQSNADNKTLVDAVTAFYAPK